MTPVILLLYPPLAGLGLFALSYGIYALLSPWRRGVCAVGRVQGPMARVVGRIEAEGAPVVGLEGVPCVAFRSATIHQGKRTEQRQQLSVARLTDETGSCVVELQHCELHGKPRVRRLPSGASERILRIDSGERVLASGCVRTSSDAVVLYGTEAAPITIASCSSLLERWRAGFQMLWMALFLIVLLVELPLGIAVIFQFWPAAIAFCAVLVLGILAYGRLVSRSRR